MITLEPSPDNVQACERQGQQIEDMLLDKAQDVAELWGMIIKDELSVPVQYDGKYVHRSSPGEPPRKETGTLQKMVDAKVTREGDNIVITVAAGPAGRNAYPGAAARLENELDRPFMAPAFEEIAKVAPDILLGNI